MNERIKELSLQATDSIPDDVSAEHAMYLFQVKFAELIVSECVTNIVLDTANWPGDEGRMAYYQGVQDAVNSIRKHFGVES